MGLSNSGKITGIKDLTTWPTITLQNGVQLNGLFSLSGTTGTAYTVYYSTNASLTYAFGDAILGGGTPQQLSSNEQTQFIKAMQEWQKVCGISFAGASTTPQLVLSKVAAAVGTLGVMVPDKFVNDKLTQADVTVSTSITDFSVGKKGFETMMHELGHAMGISHPSNSSNYDDTTTIMSYNEVGTYATTPMLYDIAAAQFLYGANTTYNATSTNYSGDTQVAANKITGEAKLWTVWDAGGTDTFDFSKVPTAAAGGDVTIELRGGVDADGDVRFSAVGQERIAIALDSANDNYIPLQKTA